MIGGLSKFCEECNSVESHSKCIECEQNLCKLCDEQIHRGGKRKTHIRVALCSECTAVSTQICYTCTKNLCNACLVHHIQHNIQQIYCKKIVAVYWDLNSQKLITNEDVTLTLSYIDSNYENIEMIKVYGESCYKWKNIFDKYSVTYSNLEGIRDSEAMIIDISLFNKDTITEILVISSKAVQLKAHLNQIQLRLPKAKIYVSVSFPTIVPVALADITSDRKSFLALPKGSIRTYSSELKSNQSSVEKFPVFHSFPRKKYQTAAHDHLLTYLKELADTGSIMHDAGWLCRSFAQKSRIAIDQSTSIIKELEKLGHVHTEERAFCNLKIMHFTCLKLDTLSLECLLWTLRSLKIDEMLPTERAIQSRMKEVFDFKVTTGDWNNMLDVCRGMFKHGHTKSAPDQPKTNYSLFSSHQSLYTNPTPVFVVKEITDTATGQKVHVVYPKDEEWESRDQHIKEGDSLGVKGTKEWSAYIEFLSGYFANCKPGDDSRAIPGGRYGCAQFLKFCGNSTLRDCSLGKLSYMVQLSIDEDMLRYHRTLLIWVQTSNKLAVDQESSDKIQIIQQKIVEILKEFKDGMSLAQLPLYIKRKLAFPLDLAELGFAKLKDLLLTMPEVDVELRGTNHPFAVYKSKGRRNKEDEVKRAVHQILTENKSGMYKPKLETLLNSKLGYFINWNEFKCTNIIEFLYRSGLDKIEVVGNGESNYYFKLCEEENLGPELEIRDELRIRICGENGEDTKEESFGMNDKSTSQRSFDKNPYEFDTYFDPFNYRNPPGFN